MVGKAADTERAAERRETDEALAERLLKERLARAEWADERLSRTVKGHPGTVAIGRQIHRLNSPLPGQFVLPSAPTHTPIPQIDYSGEFND
jgi:hypothetical protein